MSSTIPWAMTSDEESFSLSRFRSVQWWRWARNGMHYACDRGREVVSCTGIALDLGVGGGVAAEKTLEIPVYATPHERYYRCQVEYAITLPAGNAGVTVEHWLASEDRVGAGHLLEDIGKTRTLARRSAVVDDLVPPLAYQGIEESARCLSGWHLHTTDADLDSDRIIRLHLDASLQPIYLIGACVVGFSEEADLWP